MKLQSALIAGLAAALATLNAQPNDGFAKIADPFLVNYCLDCHDSDVQKGGIQLDELMEVKPENAELWKSVWEQVALGEMPPRDKKGDKPTLQERLDLSHWITSELEQKMAKLGGFHTHLHPAKANHLPHEALFGDIPKDLAPTSTPARVWRIHPQEHLVRLNALINTNPEYDPKAPGKRTHGDPIPWNTLGEIRVYYGLDRINSWTGGSAAYTAAITGFPAVLSTTNDHGLRNYPILYSVNGAEATQVSQTAENIVRYMAYGPPGEPWQFIDEPKKVKRPKRLEGLDIRGTIESLTYKTQPTRPLTPVYDMLKEPGGVTPEKTKAAVHFLFENLTGRPPTAEETDAYVKMVSDSIADIGEKDGAILGLSAIFLDPEALFRAELVQSGKPDQHGRIQLQDWELALALNAAFSYLPPNPDLRQAVLDGKMKTKEDAQREITRIINDPTIRKPRILQFFREYFDYDLAGHICKDDKALAAGAPGPKGYAEQMFAMSLGTDRLVELILEEDKNVLKELLTTDRVVLSNSNTLYYSTRENIRTPQAKPDPKNPKKKIQPSPKERGHTIPPKGKKLTVRTPGLRYYNGQDTRTLTTLPIEERRGILTHPSWLISHSDAMDNHAILRGKWVRERLLGDAVPDVPITVDAMLPDEPGTTLRHRMRVTREEECWRCHQKMDALGLPFEMFNHVGLYRTTEYGKPVDTTGAIIHSGDPNLDGPVTNAIDMIDKLAASDRVEQVFIRHVFRFWVGRNETVEDAPVLQAAWKAYRDNNGSMNALLTSILTSDAFLYRTK